MLPQQHKYAANNLMLFCVDAMLFFFTTLKLFSVDSYVAHCFCSFKHCWWYCIHINKQAWRYLLTNQVKTWMKTWAKDRKHLSRPGSHSRRQGRLENGWRERYPFPRVQCSGEHRGIGRSGVMAGTITLMWISGCLPAPGSLTKHSEGWWKVLADAKKERQKDRQTERKSRSSAQVFQSPLDGNWKKWKSRQAPLYGH